MFVRVWRALKMFLKSKWIWHRPPPSQIVIIDAENQAVLLPLLGQASYQVIKIAREEYYLNGHTILLTVCYLPRSWNLHVAYLMGLVRQISPQIVITFIDNNYYFQQTARLIQGVRFLAIQNGGRLLERDHPKDGPPVYHSEFACMGEWEVDQYRRHGAIVRRYYPIGSLKESYYRNWLKETGNEDIQQRKKAFDLCVISQVRPTLQKVFPEQMKSFELLADFLRIFCRDHYKSICVASRCHPENAPNDYRWELDWYISKLGRQVVVVPHEKGQFMSYQMTDTSVVSLGMHSTLVREAFGRGNRILSCNFTENPVYNFPVDGPWALNEPNYELFERQLLNLLEMPDADYAKVCGRWPKYHLGHGQQHPTDQFLKGLIADAAKNQRASIESS